MNNSNLSKDSFSIHRVGMIASYYRPIITRQLLVYLSISFIFACITLVPAKFGVQIALFSIIWTVIPLMFELAPIAFCKYNDSRMFVRMLPASSVEKFTFYCLYLLILIPAVVYILPEGALWIYKYTPVIQTEEMNRIVNLHLQNPFIVRIMNAFTSLSAVMTCLYVCERAKTGRTLKGVLSVFAVQLGAGLLGAIYGLAATFSRGFMDGLTNKECIADQDVIANRVLSDLMSNIPWLIAITTLFAIYFIIISTLCYRRLKKGNL